VNTVGSAPDNPWFALVAHTNGPAAHWPESHYFAGKTRWQYRSAYIARPAYPADNSDRCALAVRRYRPAVATAPPPSATGSAALQHYPVVFLAACQVR